MKQTIRVTESQLIEVISKTVKKVLREDDGDMYHYVIHTALGTTSDAMGDLYWVKANKKLLNSQIREYLNEQVEIQIMI